MRTRAIFSAGAPHSDAALARCETLFASPLSRAQDHKRGEYLKTDENHVRQALLTTRKEALSLYRAVIRASVFFVWRDERGRGWRDVIRDSARKEFEAGRLERDPEMVNRLLLTGRDAVDQAVSKFLERREAIQREEDGGDGKGSVGGSFGGSLGGSVYGK